MEDFDELVRLAEAEACLHYNEDDKATVERWRELFSYSADEAWENITEQRNGLSRTRLNDQLWSMYEHRPEAEGHDKESSEHKLYIQSQCKPACGVVEQMSNAPSTSSWLMILKTPLHTAWRVAEAARLDRLPPLVPGKNEAGQDADACVISTFAKIKILQWAAKNAPTFRPYMTKNDWAAKELSDDMANPSLGVDTTLPQFRAIEAGASQAQIPPKQDEYPVWYIFYGTLADPDRLEKLLAKPASSFSVPRASIKNATIRTWGEGKYKTVIDSSEADVVEGWAFVVQTEEEEDALRRYETDKYEVARCEISIEDGRVERGLTFRWAGGERELDPA